MISPFHHATGLFLYPMKISVKFLIKLQTTLFSHLTESHSIHSKKKNDLYYLEYFISLVVKNIVAVFEKNIKVAYHASHMLKIFSNLILNKFISVMLINIKTCIP